MSSIVVDYSDNMEIIIIIGILNEPVYRKLPVNMGTTLMGCRRLASLFELNPIIIKSKIVYRGQEVNFDVQNKITDFHSASWRCN